MNSVRYLDDGTAVLDTGSPHGLPIVFIHGLGLNHKLWDPFIDGLKGRYRLVSYDLYGHGQSTGIGENYTLSTFSGQLETVLNCLEIDQACLVGFSLGGMINRRFALDQADRVSALAIFNSPHERDRELQKTVEKQAMDAGVGGPAATLEAALERWMTPEFMANNAVMVERIREWVLSCNPVGYAAARRVLAFGVTELIRPEPPITHPTLVMTCENDRGSTPAMSQAISGEIPGSRAIIVPGLRHLGLVEHPASFLKPLNQFLESPQGQS